MKWRAIFLILFSVCISCSQDNDNSGLFVFSDLSDFNQSQSGWTADFADYPVNEADTAGYDLKFSYTTLPSEIDVNRKGIKMSGNDYSTDLFMFITKKVDGLHPNTEYTVVFEVELASNAQTEVFGGGSAPGESVFLKAGAASNQPEKVIAEGKYVLNIDKGNKFDGGQATTLLGNIGVAPNTTEFTLITRSNDNAATPFTARSNDNGELWLIIGTDSSYAGPTTVYYTRINVVFSSYY